MSAPLIVVYGDSMCLPSIADRIPAHQTYPELLATALGGERVYNRAEGGKTINDHWARYDIDHRYVFAPGPGDLLIIHAGMVDCAPRPLPQKWRRRLDRQPRFIRQPIDNWLKKNRRHLLDRGWVFYKVEPAHLQERIHHWLQHATALYRQVALVAISPIDDNAEQLLPGWRKNILLYNDIMAQAAAQHRAHFIPLHQALASQDQFRTCICPRDGYHLTPQGHQLVSDLIQKSLAQNAPFP